MSLKLYQLLPYIIQLKDTESKAGPEGVFERIVSLLEAQGDITSAEIETLRTLNNAELCVFSYIAYISRQLGMEIEPDSSQESFQRWLTLNIEHLHRIKATHFATNKQLEWIHNEALGLLELWKSTLHERGNYSREQAYGYGLRAARFDMYRDVGGEFQYLTPTDADPYVESIRDLIPIHALLRPLYRLQESLDQLPELQDSSHTLTAAFEVAENLRLPIEQTFALQTTCFGECEVACQSPVELATCEYNCETLCENWCETQCQNKCQIVCQTLCEMGCEDSCTFETCQISCVAGSCEGACEAGGCEEPPCSLACQVFEESSTAACKTGCQVCSEVDLYPARITCVDDTTGKVYGYVYLADSIEQVSEMSAYEQEQLRLTVGACSFSFESTCALACEGGTQGPCDTTCETTDECRPLAMTRELKFNSVGRAARFFIADKIAGTLTRLSFRHGVHTPQVTPGQWIMVKRSIKEGAEPFRQEICRSSDGVNNGFGGTIAFQPHPCSIRVYAEGAPKEAGRANYSWFGSRVYSPKFDHIETELQPYDIITGEGDWVRIWNVRGDQNLQWGYYYLDQVIDHEYFSIGCDNMAETVHCALSCETGCELYCETGCESSCEKAACETGCIASRESADRIRDLGGIPFTEKVSYAAGVRPEVFVQTILPATKLPGIDTTEHPSCHAYCMTHCQGGSYELGPCETICETGCETSETAPTSLRQIGVVGDIDEDPLLSQLLKTHIWEDFKRYPGPGRDFCVYFKKVPPKGAKIYLEYYRECDIEYSLLSSVSWNTGLITQVKIISLDPVAIGDGWIEVQALDQFEQPVGDNFYAYTRRMPVTCKVSDCFPKLSVNDIVPVYLDASGVWNCAIPLQGILVTPPDPGDICT